MFRRLVSTGLSVRFRLNPPAPASAGRAPGSVGSTGKLIEGEEELAILLENHRRYSIQSKHGLKHCPGFYETHRLEAATA